MKPKLNSIFPRVLKKSQALPRGYNLRIQPICYKTHRYFVPGPGI